MKNPEVVRNQARSILSGIAQEFHVFATGGGHAVVALYEPTSDPIHKATIIPRGRALGMVMRLPERDQLSITREKMFGNISVAMGGRIAEEMIFGYDNVTSGASSDIEMVTKMAKNMVTRYGMSDQLGPIAYQENEEEVFLGRSVSRTQNVSEETAKKIDFEVKKIVEAGYARAKMIEEELTYITVWVNMGASISKQDRDNETEYFDKAYSLFLSRCESISHYCDNVKYPLVRLLFLRLKVIVNMLYQIHYPKHLLFLKILKLRTYHFPISPSHYLYFLNHLLQFFFYYLFKSLSWVYI